MAKPRSPRIVEHAWGRIVLDNGEIYKDAKLFPGGARTWDWQETGTAHLPGIQPADVEELLERGAEVVVLGRGFDGRLQVQPDTLELLAERSVRVRVERTEEAVRLYNQLAETCAVGGLFHSTC
jgi:hypothetical protein